MTEVLRYEVGSGTVLVETADDSYGVDHPARNEQGILDTGRRLEDALASVRPAARAALEAMAELTPEQIDRVRGEARGGRRGGDCKEQFRRPFCPSNVLEPGGWTPARGRNYA